jgi:hypothetical protein
MRRSFQLGWGGRGRVLLPLFGYKARPAATIRYTLMRSYAGGWSRGIWWLRRRWRRLGLVEDMWESIVCGTFNVFQTYAEVNE